jgi:Cys-rich four helix bundle protein (predicted Tat secretion target)
LTVALTSITGVALGGDDEHAEHRDGHSAAGLKHQSLVDAALGCVKAGNGCIDHCIELLLAGDTSLGDCARAVQQMLATCDTLAKLAAYDSKFLPEYAKICAEICRNCQTECRKHESHHAACKACAESCAKCIVVYDMVAA